MKLAMSDYTPYSDYEWLYDQYWIQKKTTVRIAEECGVRPSTITYWMRKTGIPSRIGGAARAKDIQT